MRKSALDLGAFTGSTVGAVAGTGLGILLSRKLGLKGAKALLAEAGSGAAGYNVGYEALKSKKKPMRKVAHPIDKGFEERIRELI
jgi:hypothetical protein